MILKKLSQKGDTIIEVLIAVAVVGFILSTSYALANRSTQGVRAAQERGEALKLSEAQLEKLKLHLARGNTWPANGECILDDGTVVTDRNQCRLDEGGSFSPGGRYNVWIDENAPNQFVVMSNWEKVGGGVTEELSMTVRIHQDTSDPRDYERDPFTPIPDPDPDPVPEPEPEPEPNPTPDPCRIISGIRFCPPPGWPPSWPWFF